MIGEVNYYDEAIKQHVTTNDSTKPLIGYFPSQGMTVIGYFNN
jgi:hypothetical protein